MNETNNKTVSQQADACSKAEKPGSSEAKSLHPVVDIIENADGVTLYVDLPGVNKASLELDVDQNVLSIKGRINLPVPENLQPSYIEIDSGTFERRFTLGGELDNTQIKANLNQGELKLFIPRSEQHKPRKIAVKVI